MDEADKQPSEGEEVMTGPACVHRPPKTRQFPRSRVAELADRWFQTLELPTPELGLTSPQATWLWRTLPGVRPTVAGRRQICSDLQFLRPV
jgi:hypothetical protein